jgi:unconventional prefoldin RPB5 interactor 1
MKKNVSIVVSALAVATALSLGSFALADEQTATVSVTAVSVDSSTTQADQVVASSNALSSEPEKLDGIAVEEPKSIPSGFGLWWKNLSESVSLGLTFDPVKKAEKQLKFAEERTKLAQYMLTNSTDPKVQEKAQQMLQKATEYTQKIEAKKDELAQKKDERSKKLMENIAKHYTNQEKVLEKVEDKIPADKLEQFTQMRKDAEEKAKLFLENLKNDANVPQEVKDKISEGMAKMQEIQTQRDALRAQEKTLLDQVKQGNEEAKKQLESFRDQRAQEVQKLQDEFKAQREELVQKIQSGDKAAVEELKKLNEEQRKKAEEVKKELQQKVQEVRKEVMQKNGEVRKQVQEKRQELEKKAQEVKKEVRQQVKEYRPEPKDNAVPGTQNPVQKVILP